MNSWAKQPGESDAEYFLFQLWLTREYSPTPWRLEKRDIAKLAVYTNRDIKDLATLCTVNRWQQRAVDFDQSRQARRLLGQADSNAEFQRRRNRVLDAGLDLLEEGISHLKAQLASGKGKVYAGEVAKLADTILKFENEARGAQQEEAGGFLDAFDLTGLSDAELKVLEKIAAKAKRR